jgi:hypothetical protein
MRPVVAADGKYGFLLPCAIRGSAVRGATVQAQLFELAGIEGTFEDLFQILADVNGVIFLTGSEDQVAIVDANDFPLGQRCTFAIADAEGIEARRWPQAHFGIIELNI